MQTRILYRQENDEYHSGKTWLCTFNDMMTLLLVFFVLIFSLSTMDIQGIHSAKIQLQSGLGIFEAGKKTAIGLVAPLNTYDIGTDTFNKQIQESMEKLDLEAGINVTYSNNGIIIKMDDAILFRSGSSEIYNEGKKILKRLSENILSKISNNILVEGHTDNDPINTQEFPSNWELSTSRAVNVLRYISENGKIIPRRLSAVGYGETRPLVPNDSIVNKKINRRVELILTSDTES